MSGAVDAQHRSRRVLTRAAVFASVLVLLAAVGWWLTTTRSDTQAARRPAAPSPAPYPPKDTWTDVAGVRLPVSWLNGPHKLTASTASGFSQSSEGAGLAAVHILMRSSASTGPSVFEPTITSQVQGANAAAMKLAAESEYQRLRREAGVKDGDPVPSTATAVGYSVESYAPDASSAGVSVYVTSTELRTRNELVRLQVQLHWANDDWRVVAPPRGDWGSVATPADASPAGLIPFGDGN